MESLRPCEPKFLCMQAAPPSNKLNRRSWLAGTFSRRSLTNWRKKDHELFSFKQSELSNRKKLLHPTNGVYRLCVYVRADPPSHPTSLKEVQSTLVVLKKKDHELFSFQAHERISNERSFTVCASTLVLIHRVTQLAYRRMC